MDLPTITQTTTPEDDWDTEGFVIPSIAVEEPNQIRTDTPQKESTSQTAKEEEKIYLGPHGTPRSQIRSQELNMGNRKQKFRNKLKEADRKFSTTGWENKVENLRELTGTKGNFNMTQGSSRDWLDPHCHESQFEKHSH